jgi:hypothetical protein
VLDDSLPGLCHVAKRRPVHAHDPAIALRIEPIHDRVDENPFVPVVVEQDYSDAFAKLKLTFPDGCHRATGLAEIQLRCLTEIEDDPDVRPTLWVRGWIFNRISHGLNVYADGALGSVAFSQHPDQDRPQGPVLLAVDQELAKLGEVAARRLQP